MATDSYPFRNRGRPGVHSERLTVVDEHDRPVGVATREFVHRHGLRHRSVHILVFDPAGRLLLQKRARGKDENPGLWDTSAAGHVAAGEGYARAARRELAEELGIRPRGVPRRLFRIPAGAATGWEFCTVYRVVHCGRVQPDRGEIERVQWFTVERVTRWVGADAPDLTEAFKGIWRLYRARRGHPVTETPPDAQP
jgi:isopentenyl-diphosphate delta-isomerase type 1